MNLDQILSEAAGDPVETPEVETPETETPEVEEPETPEVTTPEDKPEQTKKSNPMKEVRDRLTSEQKAREKIEKAIQRLTDGEYSFKLKDFKNENNKVDYDALIKAMDEADLKVKAESRGLSPEVQAEIERIEREKTELRKERLRVDMDRAIANMQTELSLKGADISNFFKDSMALKKNPYQWIAQGGTLNDLYYLVYRDTLVKAEIDKAVEEAKSKWEEANNKKAPTTNPAASTKKTSSLELSIDQLLEEAATR